MASIFIRTIIVFVFLAISMKIMGKRQIGELEVSELITTLLISEICSIPIDDPDIPLLNAIIPAILIVCTEIIISSVKNKSKRLKRIFDGKIEILIYKGKFHQDTLIKNRLSLEEFFAEIRILGCADIAEIDYCFIEPNGKLSVIKKGEGSFSHIIISDGEPNYSAISSLGYDENWLKKNLGNNSPGDIFLMTVNDDGELYILLKEETK